MNILLVEPNPAQAKRFKEQFEKTRHVNRYTLSVARDMEEAIVAYATQPVCCAIVDAQETSQSQADIIELLKALPESRHEDSSAMLNVAMVTDGDMALCDEIHPSGIKQLSAEMLESPEKIEEALLGWIEEITESQE